jgi:hypothetical protein
MGVIITLAGLTSIAVVPSFLMGGFFEQFEASIPQRPWPMVLGLAAAGAYTYLFLLAILLFPDGTPYSKVGRALAALLWVALGVATIAGLLADPLGPLSNPIVGPEIAGPARAVADAMIAGFGVGALMVLVFKVYEYRQAESVRKLQLKWFIFALGIYLLFTIIGFGVIGSDDFDTSGLILDGILSALIPATMALAVLRYRLYEIDRVISRTVTYALLVVTLSLFLALPVFLLADLVGAQGDVVVAATTLAVASAFNPVRKRIQRIVDRRFNRSRYDLEAEISALATRLGLAADMAYIREETTGLVGRTLEPTAIGFWIKE